MKYFLTLIVLITTIARSQKIEDISLKHSMKQDGLALQFTVLDPDKRGVRRYDTHKTYYWYKAQKVMGTQGGSSGQLLHGPYESFYSNKQLCEKGSYEKGLRNGDWQYWRPDGSLLRTEHWNNGTQRGEQVHYSENGLVQKRTIIRGRHITMDSGDTLIEIAGNNRSVTAMDSIGRVKSVARYRNNLLHGKQETIASDGTKTVVAYKKGLLREDKGGSSRTSGTPTTTDTVAKQPLKDRIKGWFRKDDKATDPAQGEKPKKEKKSKKGDVGTDAAPKEKKPFHLFKRKTT